MGTDLFGEVPSTEKMDHVNYMLEDFSSIAISLTSQKEPSESSNKHNLHVTPEFICSTFSPDETAGVDKIIIFVKCAGKTMTVDMFPFESISVLLKEACEKAGKKPEKMNLAFEGDVLDVNRTVSQYPKIRRGTTMNLIHAC